MKSADSRPSGVHLISKRAARKKLAGSDVQIEVTHGCNMTYYPTSACALHRLFTVPTSDVALAFLSECVNRLGPAKLVVTGLHAIFDARQIRRALPSLRTRAVRGQHCIILEIGDSDTQEMQERVPPFTK